MLESLPSATRARVLVIDDDASVSDLVCAILQRSGFSVIEAHDGVEGLEQYRIHKPDLAFVDVEMPRKNGLEAIREIRAEFSHARLIAMSGAHAVHGVDTALAAREAGAQAFLRKPISLSGLLLTLHLVLSMPLGAFLDSSAVPA